MASSGKKGKRVKGKTVNLQELHAEIGSTPIVGQVQKALNWVTDVENEENNRRAQMVTLPTAPRASRILYDESIPNSPPYIVKMSNLPYDVDEADLMEFFVHLNIETIKLVKDDNDSSRSRGYGFIHFETKNDLIEAVQMVEPMIQNRRIKIDIATDQDQRHGGGNWRDNNRNNNDGEGGNRRGFSFRDRERDSGPSEDSGNWRAESRPQESPPPQRRNNYGGDRGGDRGDRGGDRGDRGDRDNWGGDRGDRGGDRDGFRQRRDYRNRDNNREEMPPAERPKLNLQPRTLPIENIIPQTIAEREPEVVVPKPAPVPAAMIFGAAKPVDTTAREREIEERMEKERQEAIAAATEAREARENEKLRKQEEDAAEPDVKEEPIRPEVEEVTSWRTKKDSGDDQDKRSNSPTSQRRYSPARDYKDRGDRRGPPRRNDREYDRRPNNRDNRDNYRSRDNRDQRNDNRDNRDRGGYENRDRDQRGGDRYGNNKQSRDGGRNQYRQPDGNRKDNRSNSNRAHDENNTEENRMPKYVAPVAPDLSMSNKYAAFDDVESADSA